MFGKVAHTRYYPCPICGGASSDPKRIGRRCYGFSFTGETGDHVAMCTREEYAGSLNAGESGAFAHTLNKHCYCGSNHQDHRYHSFDTPKHVISGDRNREIALDIWRECLSIEGTMAMKYLNERGIDIPLPDDYRYHPCLHDVESSTGWGALVCAVRIWGLENVKGIHRTYIDHDALGRAVKAPIGSPKKRLGEAKGGAVRIGAEPAEELIVTEGIEDALSIHQESGKSVWAIMGTHYSATIYPSTLKRLTICTDADEDGLKGAHRSAARLVADGLKVLISTPLGGAKDFNEQLNLSSGCAHDN